MPTISVHLLGTPVIELEGKQITFALKKADALFFYLCIEKNTTRSMLANLLWGGQSDDAARKNLRNALYAIKKSFGFDPFESPKKQILKLNSSVEYVIDTDLFLKSGDLSLYQNAFLYGFYLKDSYEYDEWMNNERAHFLDLYLQQLFQHFQALPEGDVSGREEIFHRYTEADSLDERIYGLMMQTYQNNELYLKGIRCYESLVHVLKTETGLTPPDSLNAMYRKMVQNWNESISHPKNEAAKELLAGRSREMSVLMQACQRLFLGQGSTIFVTGERGVGKTYLCETLLSVIRDDDLQVLSAACLEQEQTIPLAIWNVVILQISRVLESAGHAAPPRSLQMLEQIFAMLESLGNPAALPHDLSTSYNYRALKNTVIRLFSILSEQKPVLLFLDDIQNMDALSADWLSTLIRQGNGRILILLTCPLQVSDTWNRYINQLVCQKNVSKLILERFTREDVRLLMQRRRVDPSLLESIYTKSQGNPFFLEIILDNAANGESDLSARAQDILNARLSTLSRAERQLLDLISICSDYTTLNLLQFVMDQDPVGLMERIESLKEKELIIETESSDVIQFRFRHPKMREYVESLLSPSKARIFHSRIADYLEHSSQPRDSRWYTQMIYHCERSGSQARCLYYRILQIGAYSDLNFDLYPVLTASPETGRISADQMLEELFSTAHELSLCFTKYPGQIPYEEAEALLNLSIVKISIQQGYYEQGLKYLERTLSVNACVNSRPDLRRSFLRQQIYYGIQTYRTDVMKEAIDKCRAIDKNRSDLSEQAIDDRLLGLYLSMTGEYDDSDRMLNTAIEKFHRSPLKIPSYTVNLAACYNYLGENHRRRGDWKEAAAMYRHAISISSEHGGMENPTFYVNLAHVLLLLGQDAEAGEMAGHAHVLYQTSAVRMGRCMLHLIFAVLAARAGDLKQSGLYMQQAEKDAGMLTSPMDQGYYCLTAAYLRKQYPRAFRDILPKESRAYTNQAEEILGELPEAEELHRIIRSSCS